MLVDEVTITVQGGHGGKGAVTFFAMKNGPSGGEGGKGGDVYVTLNPQLVSLHKYIEKNSFKAQDGHPGMSNRRSGSAGEDLYLQLPAGVSLKDLDTGEEFELTPENSPLLICKGGKGGLGNDAFKSSTNQTPKKSQPGEAGQKRQLRVVMRLIANYGLIGLPNAGKSSLLNELTAAHAKTANYPFTTLEPNLGVLNGKVIADIPGLIEGASLGKGLGTKFLKHIEKVELLIHCISVESENVVADYDTVIGELARYNSQLLQKPSIILLTKTDLAAQDVVGEKLHQLKSLNEKVFPVSIHDWDSLEALKRQIL